LTPFGGHGAPKFSRVLGATGALITAKYKKLIRRQDSERELSLPRHRTRTTKYNRLVHKFHHRLTRLCVGTHVYQTRWNNAMAM